MGQGGEDPVDGVMDEADFLRRIGDDGELAARLAGVLVASLPTLEATLARAVAGGQAVDIGRAAHAIKGAVATFSAARAVAAARALEDLGREAGGPVQGEAAARAHTGLTRELAALRAHLEARYPSAP